MNGIQAAFQGYLSEDVQRRWRQNGTPMLMFSVAVHDSKLTEGATPEWVKVAVFGDSATDELAAELTRGREVYLKGRLRHS